MKAFQTHATLIDFLRHGEPIGGRRYRGQIDDPLSEKGWAQMHAAVAGAEKARPWQAVVSSPLVRCHAFAQTLAAAQGLPLSLEPRFKEVGFGAWEGKTADELNTVDPGCVMRFKGDPVSHRPAGAEALDDFSARVNAGLEALLQAYTGGHVLVVTHAGVMRMVICQVLGLSPAQAYRIEIGSAAMLRIRIEVREQGRLPQLLWLTPAAGKRAFD